MKKVQRFLALYWQTLLSGAAILVVVFGLLGFRLGSNMPGLSLAELRFIESSASLDAVLQNPLYLPMKLPMLALQYFELATIATLRAVGSVIGVITVIIFYLTMRQWHTRRTALLTAFLLIVSSWFLHISRLALPYVLFAFAMTMLLAAVVVLHNKQSSKSLLLLASFGLSFALYVPGMVWLLAILTVWQYKLIGQFIKKLAPGVVVVAVLGALLILAPLGYALFRNPALLTTWLALPSQLMPLEWLRRLLVLPVFLTAQGPLEPVYNLGRLPLLDVFTTALVVLGTYAYSFKTKLRRTQLLAVLVGLSMIFIAINGPAFLPLLLPLVFVVAGAGLTLLLQQWFTVFPRNPIARAIGVVTIALVIAITGMYHARRYFVAWAGNPESRAEFIYPLDSQ